MKTIFALALALWATGASAQNMKCPVCKGPNVALQFDNPPIGCFCGSITGAVGPAGPQGIQGIPGPAASIPASPCAADGFTDRWNGTAWVCTPTRFLTY